MGFLDSWRKRETPQSPPARPAERPAEARPAPARALGSMSVQELKRRLDRGDKVLVLDVREPWEYNVAHLEAAVLVPLSQIRMRLGELDKGAEIVVQCHHGNRSQVVGQFLLQNGFSNVANLEGGIDAWSRYVDSQVPLY